MTTTLIASLVGIGVLLVLSAFFSGSETALTTASRSRLHQMERRGNRRARTVGRLIERRERLIGTILLGNNAVNILASALATSVLITLVGEAGVAYATVAMTLLVLVFSEILPKTYAIRHADRVALAVAPVTRVLVFVSAPIVAALHAVVRGGRLGGLAQPRLPALRPGRCRPVLADARLQRAQLVPRRQRLPVRLRLHVLRLGDAHRPRVGRK